MLALRLPRLAGATGSSLPLPASLVPQVAAISERAG
jgi:hypothetical protein